MKIRSITEHFAITNTHLYNMPRTTYANLFEHLFITPYNLNII